MDDIAVVGVELRNMSDAVFSKCKLFYLISSAVKTHDDVLPMRLVRIGILYGANLSRQLRNNFLMVMNAILHVFCARCRFRRIEDFCFAHGDWDNGKHKVCCL